MPTFIIKNNPGLKNPIELTKDDEHHLKKVLRAKVGEVFSVTDNEGALGKIKMTNHNPMQFELIETTQGAKPFPIKMFMPLIEQTRLEWAIEKLCELNIETVQLIITERTQGKNFSEKKIARLQKIAETAQKQCGRAYPLKIYPEKKLKDLSFSKTDLNLVATIETKECHLDKDPAVIPAKAGIQTPSNNWIPHQVRDDKMKNAPVNLFVGPEGGFSEQEEKFLVENGCQKTSLGPTILRTETAALVLVSKILQFKNP